MIFLKINDIKGFTSLLLVKDTMEQMELVEGTIKTHSAFVIDGTKNMSYFTDADEEPESRYTTWERLRPVCYEIIKGRQLPTYFKFVFRLDIERTTHIVSETADFKPEDVTGLFLNIKYENNTLSLTTGTSLAFFTLDKSLEKAFDRFVTDFLVEHSIDFSIC